MSINDTNLSLKMLEDSVDRLPPRQVQIPGPSAYEDALAEGFHGSRRDWLKSLRGADGKSAYEVAVDNGYEGTEEEWIDFVSHVESEAQRQANETQRVEAEAKREALFEEWKAVVDLKQIQINQANISKNDKRITNIEQGLTPDSFETDDSVAYQKDVPANALPYAAVQKVGGMTRKCTNLIPFSYYGTSTTVNGVIFTVNSDGSVTLKGTATNIGAFYLSKKAKLPAGIYSAKTDNVCEIRCYHQDGTATTFSNNNQRIDVPNPIVSIALLVRGGNEYDGTIKPMLNAGSTALPYEPYFEGLRSANVTEVKSVGANLFGGDALKDKFKAEMANTSVNTTDKTISYYASAAGGKTFFTDFKPNTQYTFIFKGVSNANFLNMSIVYTDGTSVDYLRFNGNNVLSTLRVVSDPSKSIKSLMGIYYDGYTTLYYDECGIFEGVLTADDFKPYVKHTIPIPEAVRPANGINENVYDYIEWVDGGSVKKTVKCGEVVLDGSSDEEWFTYTDSDSIRQEGYCYRILIKEKSLNPQSLASNFNYVYKAWDFGGVGDFCVGTVDSCVYFVSDISTLSAFLAHIANNPIKLVYELAEPIVTDISNLITADNLIGVEGGGTLTFENEYGYAVPSEVEYQVEV